MTGLSKITDKIISEANADVKAKLDLNDGECRKIIGGYKNKALNIKKALDERAEKEAEGIISRAKSSASMVRRNVLLTAKSDLVDKAFDRAFEEIRSFPDEKYLDLLVSMLTAILSQQVENERESIELYGDEDAPASDRYEIILNASDREKYGKVLLDGVRRRLIGKGSKDITEKVFLSSTVADIDGGLILRYGNIEINSSLSILFEQTRPALEADVSKVLFN